MIPSPLGGNAARLGALLAGPLAAGLLWTRRPRLLAGSPCRSLYWVLYAPVRDWAERRGRPVAEAAYYAPLLARSSSAASTASAGPRGDPFTARHWEPRASRPHVLLARGWERQLDRK